MATVGASLVLFTVIVKLCDVTAPELSVAVKTTLWEPTSLFVGVPDKTPVLALKDNQVGFVEAASVNESPASGSSIAKV